MNRTARIALFVLACILAAACTLPLAGCGATASFVGLESTSVANERAAEITAYADTVAEKQAVAKQAETEGAIVASFAILGPDAQKLARDLFDGKQAVVVPPTSRPEPRPDPSEDLGDIIGHYVPEIGLGLGILAAYIKSKKNDEKAAEEVARKVNEERDGKRRRMGEATNEEEAIALGQIPTKGPTA